MRRSAYWFSCFNPRLRTGGDSQSRFTWGNSSSFNPRLRTGGDNSRSVLRRCSGGFQSTPPHGRRHSYRVFAARKARFNPRLRTGGDSLPASSGGAMILFQSTPPHGRRPPGKLRPHRDQRCFNPRLRTGGDNAVGAQASRCRVSIHASAREATRHGRRKAGAESGFNPRLRTGGDPASVDEAAIAIMFQSTPPHGRRPATSTDTCARPTSFNPRLRTGGDLP